MISDVLNTKLKKIHPIIGQPINLMDVGTVNLDYVINMSDIEDLQIELENALDEIEQLKCSTYPIVIFGDGIYVDMACPTWRIAAMQWYERFDGHPDEYEPDKEHKFVKLYLANMIEDD